MAAANKLKVLCLHGYQQSGAIFRDKSGGFRSIFKKHFDFVYMDAPHIVDAQPVGDAKSSEEKHENDDTVASSVHSTDAISKEEQKNDNVFYGWWYVKACYNKREVEDYEGFDESVNAVVDFIRKEGPFDGILAFSQGAALAHLLAALRQKGEIDIAFKFLVLISCFGCNPPSRNGLSSVRVPDLPCLYVYGKTDKIIGWERSVELAKQYDEDKIVVIEHPGGHMMPNLSKFKTHVRDFLELLQNISHS